MENKKYHLILAITLRLRLSLVISIINTLPLLMLYIIQFHGFFENDKNNNNDNFSP